MKLVLTLLTVAFLSVFNTYSQDTPSVKYTIRSLKFAEQETITPTQKNFIIVNSGDQSMNVYFVGGQKDHYDLIHLEDTSFEFEGETLEGYSYTAIDKFNTECSIGFFISKKYLCTVLFIYYNSMEYFTYLIDPVVE